MKHPANLGIKLTSVFVAIVLWLHIATDRPAQTERVLATEVIGVADGLVLTKISTEPWRLSLAGPGKSLLQRPLHDMIVQIDLGQLGEGDFMYPASSMAFLRDSDASSLIAEFPASPQQPVPVTLPAIGATQVRSLVSPADFHVRLERMIEREVPIVAKLINLELAGRARIREPLIEPARVTVRGPRNEVENLENISTEVIHPEIVGDSLLVKIDGRNAFGRLLSQADGTEFEVLLSVEGLGPLSSLAIQKAQVTLDVQSLLQRQLSDVPVQFLNGPRNLAWSTTHRTISLLLAGPSDVVESIDPAQFQVFVDLSPLRASGVHLVAAEIPMVPNVELIQAIPAFFPITLGPNPGPQDSLSFDANTRTTGQEALSANE